MKNRYYFILSILIWSVGSYLMAFQPRPVLNEQPVGQIKQQYVQGLKALAQSLAQLDAAARAYDHTSAGRTALEAAFRQSRLSYKNVEFLLAYLDPEADRNYLNGAPLPKLEPNAPGVFVLAPAGLQVIDEIIFGDELPTQAAELQKHTAKLAEAFALIDRYQQTVPLSDRQVFEAVRFGLVRTLALGVTGFDTPASGHALPEAIANFAAMGQAMAAYAAVLRETDPAVARLLTEKFTLGEAYLRQAKNFDNFDRLTFLTDYINPLFKAVRDAQLVLGVETVYETIPANVKLPFNYLSDNLFAADFLNAGYFSRTPEATYSPATVALGKMLFFEPLLSANNERACASCHNPQKAFTDGQRKSIANNFEGTVERNAPTLVNSIFSDRLFYDLRAEKMEDQFAHVVASHQEFNTDYLTILNKLRSSDEYVTLFRAAFPEMGDQPVQTYSVTTALGAYVRSLTAFNSPFDRYVRGETDHLDVAARRGFNLFMGKAGCGTCHFAPVFNGAVPPLYDEMESEVLGVPSHKDPRQAALDPDRGRGGSGILKERSSIYNHSFKTVTVRNAALTAPYMHNGVYDSLEEVVDFYNRGGGQGLGLDVPNQTLPPDPLGLSKREQRDLVAFMRALTDTTGLTDVPTRLPAFADPVLDARVIGGKY